MADAMNRSRPLSTHQLLARITERDGRILSSVAEFRLLSTTQIRDLHFAAHASKEASIQSTWLVLRRLEHLRLLQRVGRQRRFATGGSTPVTWALGTAGERLTRFLAGERDAPRRRSLVPLGEEYHHTLAVADVYLHLVRAHRAGRIDLVEAHGEPASWRAYPGQLGRAITLKPDLAFVTQTPEYRDHWFAEVDLGHQSVPRLIRKCIRYEEYRTSGAEQRTLGVFPRVLWLLPNHRRAELLRAAIARDPHINSNLFTVIEADDLLAVISDEPGSAPQAAAPDIASAPASDPARGFITKHRADERSTVSGAS